MGQLLDSAERIASGRSSSLNEVEQALDRVDASSLNAFTVVARDEALERARACDSASSRGILHGVPIVVKDLFDVAGWPTTGCSRLYEGRVAETDAPVVTALLQAGAVIIAKTNMHELAFGATGD